jgi:hypothetical protein
MQQTQHDSFTNLLLAMGYVFALAGAHDLYAGALEAGDNVGFSMLQNTVEVTGVSFEPMTNTIKVTWTIDTAGAGNALMDVGIFWSMAGYPLDENSQPDAIKPNTMARDSMSLQMGQRLRFETRYYFSLVLRKGIGAWSAFAEKAKGSLLTPAFAWQTVRYGVGIPLAYANNETVRISVDPVTFPTGVDNNAVARWAPPAPPTGFIPMSMGFEFLSKYQSTPLGVGVKCAPLPLGHVLSEIKMYRYNDGLWFLDKSPRTYDTAHGYISVTTGDISCPFIAMIDVQPPAVTVMSHPERAVYNGKSVSDTFFLSDNCANTQWKFSFGKGGEGYSDAACDSAALSSPFGTIVTVIPAGFVSADQGVRALLWVSDGVNVAVKNVSRRVIRNIGGSDVVAVDSMKWTPLCVTAQLDSPSVRGALKVLFHDGVWKYDKTKFRLFRWIADAEDTGDGTNRYVEYCDERDSLFTFTPGRLFWIKVRKPVVVDFGRGITPELTQTSVIHLSARSWTDFALPFNFSIRIGDIIDATAAAGEATEGLRFCSWFRDTTRRYSAKELYAPRLGVKDLQDVSRIMEAKQLDGTGVAYSAYNQSDAAINLFIPPLPASLSNYKGPLAMKTKVDGGKTIKIDCRTSRGIVLNDVYCVCASGSRTRSFLPAAPSLGGTVAVRICDERMRQFGHVIDYGGIEAQGGTAFDLAFNNGSDHAEEVLVSASRPGGLRVALFNPANGMFAENSEAWRIEVASGASIHCQLFAGSDAFMAKAGVEKQSSKAALIDASVNPLRRSLRIRYTLPMESIGRAMLAIFDMQGRKLWSASCRGRMGMSEMEWDGAALGRRPVASGIFVLQMIVIDAAGTTAVLKKKLTWLPY